MGMATILMIDDNKDNLIVFKSILSESFPDSKLIFAESGKRGIELCHLDPPDVILLDLIMPDMDGFEVCKIIKSEDFLKNIPIIIVTASKTEKALRVNALELGADAFLSKPIDEAELIAQIKVMLRIKELNDIKLDENLRLSKLVLERTNDLENELQERTKTEEELQLSLNKLELSKIGTLNIMDDLQNEILERKVVEEALQENKSRLNLALESAQMGIWFWDMKDNKRYFDNQTCSILGIDHTNFNGEEQEFYKVVHPDDIKIITDAHALTIKTNAFYEPEYRVIHPNGTIRFINARGRLTYDAKGKPLRLNGVLWDVTDQKTAQQTIQLSNQRMSLLFEQTPLAVIEWDKEFIVREWNPAAEKIFGYSKKEAIGKHFSFITPKHDYSQVNDIAYSLIKQKSGHRSTNQNITKHGVNIICEWFNTSLVDSKGKTFGVASLVHDITERRQAEIALQNSIKQWDITFNSIQDSIMLIDPTQKIINYNKAFSDQIGKRINESKNPYCYNLVHNTNCATDNCPFGRMMQSRQRELMNYEAAGRYYACMVDPIFDDKGNISGAVHIIYDITERKRVEMELIKSKEKAEESEMLKSVFLSNMSHEIRTPLNAILGFSDFLGEPTLTNEKRKKFVNIINNSGQQLLHIINDIIDISKLDSKQLKLSYQVCNVSEMLNEIVEIFSRSESLLNKPDIKLLLNLPVQHSELAIQTDKIRLQQVFNNLITNAIKYTNQGLIEVGFELKAKNNNPFIEFWVKDSGIGIPADKHNMIFERFRQVEENGYREGTGLGLSISKGIIELLGGEIWLESEVNEGTSFFFTIPYSPTEKSKNIEYSKENQHIGLAQKIIIVAEDDFNSFSYLKELLSDSQANIIHAENGQILLDYLEHQTPDLVLLDINMPIKTGYQCMEEIKVKGYKVKVIAQTAYAMVDEREKCINAGCDGYISKPFTKKTILKAINDALGI
jgi:PAS domain S-box-containing protein